MSFILPSSFTLSCESEYGQLKKVLLCPPVFMQISEVINETQKHYVQENINVEIALKQHDEFVNVLKEHQVEVFFLPALPDYPEQVFTRDIGFTIGKKVFVSEMGCNIRKGEELILKKWLKQYKFSHLELTKERIEGGDVLVDGKNLYIGVSNRTSQAAITQLQTFLPDYRLHRIPFKKEYLHLDCVFNIVSPDEALVYSKAFSNKELQLLASHYDLIELSESEQFSLGTNILSLGNKVICSLPQNREINRKLSQRGFKIIEVDFSEIIKSGGSFRCCSMPLVRK
ncbi:dimethylarginine dimethylaminohydrolase family protein [Peribacillus acanthi]|uniref:dimethylarginine dimethylaminohydrolase family protein n=1 Tax=Peribacillus acanthi TaxID=2171554 RepID=UPI000D3E39A6|nr:dimethylarginine dimethylaminohydrolase family protein [Peribacillus acanthi]